MLIKTIGQQNTKYMLSSSSLICMRWWWYGIIILWSFDFCLSVCRYICWLTQLFYYYWVMWLFIVFLYNWIVFNVMIMWFCQLSITRHFLKKIFVWIIFSFFFLQIFFRKFSSCWFYEYFRKVCHMILFIKNDPYIEKFFSSEIYSVIFFVCWNHQEHLNQSCIVIFIDNICNNIEKLFLLYLIIGHYVNNLDSIHICRYFLLSVHGLNSQWFICV